MFNVRTRMELIPKSKIHFNKVLNGLKSFGVLAVQILTAKKNRGANMKTKL